MERYNLLKGKGKKSDLKSLRERQKYDRENKRLNILGELRNINEEPQDIKPAQPIKKKSRMELLKEWKQKKEEMAKKEVASKKKPFIVGVVHRKATGSPDVTAAPSARKGVTTRSMNKFPSRIPPIQTRPILKQLNALQGSSMKPVKQHLFNPKLAMTLQLTIPQSPLLTKRKSAKPSHMETITNVKEESNENAQVKKKRVNLLNAFEKVEDTNTESLITTNVNVEEIKRNRKFGGEDIIKINYTPDGANKNELGSAYQHLQFSPFIETRRGRSSGKRKSITLNEKIEKEIEQECRIKSSRIHEFRLFLANETSRLLALSEKWSRFIAENPSIPSDVEGDVNAVVGKTKLLTSDKFKQFEGLIDKCEGGDPQIKVGDLEGFHDWVSIEVENLDKVFFELEDKKDKGWNIVEKPKAAPTKKVAKPTKAVNRNPNAVSNMRAHIMAARMKMKGTQENSESVKSPVVNLPRTPVSTNSPVSTDPNASVLSPRHMACLSGKRPPSCLRIALRRCSGLEIVNATARARDSITGSTPVKGQDETVYPNSTSVPSKSILKQPSSAAQKKSVGFFQTTNGLDPKYFLPAEESPRTESPSILNLLDRTPLRRSTRLARKSINF